MSKQIGLEIESILLSVLAFPTDGLFRVPLLTDPKAFSGSKYLCHKEITSGKKIVCWKLTYPVTHSNLEGVLPVGTVQGAQVISDRDTGRSKGFGFVEMDTDARPKPPSRDSTIKSTTGGASRSTKPSHE